jgi:hypothetical protein
MAEKLDQECAVRIAAIVIAISLSACGVQRSTGADGTETSFRLGGHAQDCGDPGVLGVEATLFGFWITGSEFGLGARTARLACVRPGCSVILWAEPGANADALAAKVSDLEGVCVAN